MSRKLPKKELVDYSVSRYYEKARLKILEVLMKDYKMKKDQAEKIEQRINKLVRAELIEKYRLKSKGVLFTEDVQNVSISLSGDFPDFSGFHATAMMVPFYQSLGDTIGYKNGEWEFNYGETVGPEFTNDMIYEFISLGGINDLSIVHWMASDDTILYMATLKVLSEKIYDVNEFGSKLRLVYLEAVPAMVNRNPGGITSRSLDIQKNIEWNKLPYSSLDVGAGAAMRSGCIGIFFPGKYNRKKLIALAVEASRITHNSAIAILGSVVASLFTAYALEKVPLNHWPHKLLNLLRSNKIDDYMKESRPDEYPLYSRDKVLFIGQWEKYINIRFSGLTPKTNIRMMKNPVERFRYLSENFSKGNTNFPGSNGDDSVIMAYDSLLESNGVLEKLIVYAILHPGDSDTVGSIALSWFGAYYQSLRNLEIVYSRFLELEFFEGLDEIYRNSRDRIAKIYFYDIYPHTARKYFKEIRK